MRPVRNCINAVSSRLSNKSFTPKSFPGYHCVGWVKSAHGIRGEIFIQLYASKADWLSSLNNIFLLLPGGSELSAWEVEFRRPHKEGLILKVKGCSDRNKSETMRKSGAYIPESWLQAEPGAAIFLAQILNFAVLDRTGLELGKISGFATNGMQDLLRLQRARGPEALIPFVDAFIVNIDFDKHQVTMDLPPGLLSIEEE